MQTKIENYMKSIKLILSVIVIVFVALMACSSEAESAAQEKHYPQIMQTNFKKP
jgi:hypothetical protein